MDVLTGRSINLSLVLYPNKAALPMGEGHNIRLTIWLVPEEENFRAPLFASLLEKFDHQDLKELPDFAHSQSIGISQLALAIWNHAVQKTQKIVVTLEYEQLTVQINNSNSAVLLHESLAFDLSTIAESGEPIVRQTTLTISTQIERTTNKTIKQTDDQYVSHWPTLEALKNVLQKSVMPKWWPSRNSDAYALSQIAECINASQHLRTEVLIDLKHKLSQKTWSTLTH